MNYYHIDRCNTLSEGQIIDINKDFLPNNDYGKILMQKMFPDGVSNHGVHYLNDNVYFFDWKLSPIQNFALSNEQNSIYFAEYAFELVRRCFFASKPSRYTSLFALEKPDDIKLWPELTNCKYRIFEIVTENKHPTFDANFIRGGLCLNCEKMYQGFSPSINFNRAISYWAEEKSEAPKPEILLPLPVTIGKRII